MGQHPNRCQPAFHGGTAQQICRHRQIIISPSVRRRSGRLARAIIEDEGLGIPPAKLGAIFERFYTDRPKGRAFGTNSGLGLSIAKQIVEAHHGSIWAENIPGPEPLKPAGARFVVELPLVG